MFGYACGVASGLFDRARIRRLTVSLPQLCYDVAYFILPRYALHDLARLSELCSRTPTAAGPFFYLRFCKVDAYVRIRYGATPGPSSEPSIAAAKPAIRAHKALMASSEVQHLPESTKWASPTSALDQ